MTILSFSALIASQACGQTPSKINTPSKYDFPSPVKAFQARSQRSNGKGQRVSGKKGLNFFDDEKIAEKNKMLMNDRMRNQKSEKSLKLNSKKSPGPSPTLSLSDFIVKTEIPKHKKKGARKRAPILQSESNNKEDNLVVEEISTAMKNASIQELAKMTPELKKQYCNSHVWDSVVRNFDKSPDKMSLPPTNDDLVEPLPDQVTDKDKIKVLASLYSHCIRQHLVPNILMEIYLLFQLMTVKESKGQLLKTNGLLGNVHNCVFFAINVLEDQVTLLKHLDRATLKFLIENPRLEIFAMESHLQEKINEILSNEKNNLDDHSSKDEPSSFTTVPYQVETDARAMFPDTQTFQDSKKQRDMFYEMFRQWSATNSKNDIAHSVVKLLSFQTHPVNLRHFATLFIGQLLASLSEPNVESDDLKLLSSLKTKVNSDKLISRIVTRSHFGPGSGPCPDPSFSGDQEFFKEFIVHSTYAFVTHLKDILASSIMSKNDSNDPKVKYDKIVIELRILAKFLGFVEALPYQNWQQTDSPLATDPSRLDLEQVLHSSTKKRKLIITVPWIVEYCSMLDPISIKLPYYQNIFKQLIKIYKFHLNTARNVVTTAEYQLVQDNDQFSSPVKPVSKKASSSSSSPRITEFNAFFLCIHLGWLFERPSFPRELFVDDIQKKDEETEDKVLTTSIDASETCINPPLLYQCCPFVSELKVILCQFQSGFKAKRGSISAGSDARLKLATAEIVSKKKGVLTKVGDKKEEGSNDKEVKDAKSKNMQDALVAHFFQNQSASLKNAVESVIKNISNNVVCKLRKEVITDETKTVMLDISANLKLLYSSSENENDLENIKEELWSQMASMSEKTQGNIQRRCNDIVTEQLVQKVYSSLHCLLPEYTPKPVVNFCSRIIEKRIKEEANEWMGKNLCKELNVNFHTQFEKLWNDHVKALKGNTAAIKQTGVADLSGSDLKEFEILPIYDILIRLKKQTALLNSGGKILTKEKMKEEETFILSLLGQAQVSFAVEFSTAPVEEKALLDESVKGLEYLSFDWALSLFVHYPMMMTPAVQQKFIELWGGHDPKTRPIFCLREAPGSLATLFSPRNLRLLSQSRFLDEAWKKLDFFTGRLLSSGLLLPKVLELQCLELLRKELDDDTLRRFGTLLRSVIDSWQKSPIDKSTNELMDFTEELLDWLPYIFSNMNNQFDDDDFPLLQL